ncbi:MAG: glycosyltransferase family 2 protein [Burkholderiales bacterium]|jgi:glycosyltransferase involved in cell wall biosynthesis|nr:glycosyltransferase family 2 protein [Burkholderiales bacterium]
MKFSLVLATIGRSAEVEDFLRSLDAQTYRHIQLIVVDQNRDDRVERLMSLYAKDFEVKHIRSAPGLSHARNVGLKYVNGDVVAFPDDDCWYAPTLLQQVHDELSRDPTIDGITGRSIDQNFEESGGSFSKVGAIVDIYRVWSQAISYTIFLKRTVCDAVAGGFDETLGVGANTLFGSGEETDYLIRAIRGGQRLRYVPEITVFHPNKDAHLDVQMIGKALKYGCGMGRVIAKHGYPLHYRAKVLARPMLGSVLAALLLQPSLSRLRWAKAVGRFRGMVSEG